MGTVTRTPERGAGQVEPDRVAPLSYLQEQLWLIENTDPSSAAYNEHRALRLRGPLDVATLDRALAMVVARHEALRTTVALSGTGPAQAVWPAPTTVLREVVDLTDVPLARQEAEVREHARRLAELPYDLAAGPLLRCSLARLNPTEHVLVLAVHHMVSDGMSMDLLIRELDACYGAIRTGRQPSLPAVSSQYADFAHWQRGEAGSGRLAGDVGFWREALSGAPAVLALPVDRPRPRRKSARGRRDEFRIDPALHRDLAKLAETGYGTPFTALLAAFVALLYRYTGQDDMVLGTGATGRPGPAFENAMGLFANIVPVRFRATTQVPMGQLPFRDLVDAASEAAFDAFDHQHVPFEKLVEMLCPARDLSHSPLVQVVFTMWDAGPAERMLGDLRVSPVDVPRGRSRFDIAVEAVTSTAAGTPELRLFVEYDSDLFEPPTIARMVAHYERILATVNADPELPVAAIPMLTDEELGTLTADGVAVLDRDANVAPPGAIGELCRAGDPGCSGADGGSPTGLLARRGPGGLVEKRGRVDRCVQVGPFHVQLELIEAALRGHPLVSDAVVVARGVTDRAELAGYIVAGNGWEPKDPAAAVLADLERELPRYMVPGALVSLPEIPRTVDGDLDETRLPDTEPAAPAVRHPALESALRPIWADVLAVEDVDPVDDFFALGGHSMLAARLAQQITRTLGVEVALLTIFEHPTVADLAARLAIDHPGLGSAVSQIEATPINALPGVPEGGSPPAGTAENAGMLLSTAQLQIWVNEQLAGGDAKDFIAAVRYRIQGPLDTAALEQALNAVVARHENLRAGVHFVGDIPVLRLVPEATVALPMTDLSHLGAEERAAAADRLAHAAAERPFVLSEPPLLRALLLRLDADLHTLVLVQHHLITDAISLQVLMEDLEELYAAFRAGREPDPPATALRFADYVAWEQEWLRGAEAAAAEQFWRERLAGAPGLVLGPGRTTGDRASRATGSCVHPIPEPVAGEIVNFARACRATPFMVATAAFAAVLRGWSGQDDIVIGTTVDNRPLPGLERVIGCFVNVVALRIDCSGDPPFLRLLDRVRHTVLESYGQQRLPFSQVVKALGVTPRSSSRMPVFQVTSDWAGDGPVRLRLSGCSVEFDYVPNHANRYDLALYVGRDTSGLILELEYALDLWDRAVVQDRTARVARLLAAGARNPDLCLSELHGLA